MSLEEARAVFDLLDDEDDTGLFENRKAEIKAFEERMFECLFQKSDVLEADFVKRKAELREINETIEQRKNELAKLNTITQTVHPNYITEY
jgi:polyhydroxyalkanoate synthesis regulator phasin